MPQQPETRPATWEDIVAHEAKKVGIPRPLALAVARAESGFDPTAVSPKGAQGLMQLMPGTAQDLGVDRTDPLQNIRGGLTYLKQQLDANQGDVALALKAYNAGPNRRGMPTETEVYVQRVLAQLPSQAPPSGTASASPAAPSPGRPMERLPIPGPAERLNQGLEKPIGPVREPEVEAEAEKPGFLAKMAESFDPRTREGQLNWGGAAGSAAAGFAMGSIPGGFLGGLRGVAVPVLGATAGGGVVEAGRQYLGLDPRDLSVVAKAAGEQGLAESIGGGIMWAVGSLGRRALAYRVAGQASDYLTATRTALTKQLDDALETAQRATRGARKWLTADVRGARQTAAQELRGARELARQGEATATQTAAQRTADATAPYEALVAQPPPMAPIGRQVQDVVAGPAMEARNEAGRFVANAAESGPPVDVTDLKAEGQRILTEELRPAATAFPRVSAEEAVEGVLTPEAVAKASSVSLEQIAQLPPERVAAFQADLADITQGQQAWQDRLAGIDRAQEAELVKHPVMGVISRILNAPDEVPFAAAHQFKRELDDALETVWEKSTKTRVEAMTQHLRTGLRKALSGHPPYDEATAAYQKIIPLYTEGIAPELKKLAVEAPEAFVKMIKGDEPTKARFLRDLLLTQAAKGGGEAEGQAAWDAVRGAWTHRNLIRGGVETIRDRIGKLDPEFTEVFFGDESGRAVLSNLTTIQDAVTQAIDQGLTEVAAAKAGGRLSVEATRMLGQRQVDATRRLGEETAERAWEAQRQVQKTRLAARPPTAQEVAFKKSSLHKMTEPVQLMADALRAGFLGLGSIWGALSLLRLMTGPRASDLVAWAATSPTGTRAMVDILTSRAPGMAMADLLRASGLFTPKELQEALDPYLDSPIGTRPPAVTPGVGDRPPAVPELTRSPQSP